MTRAALRSAVPARSTPFLRVVLGTPIAWRPRTWLARRERPLHLQRVEERIEAHRLVPHPRGEIADRFDAVAHGHHREVARLDRRHLLPAERRRCTRVGDRTD